MTSETYDRVKLYEEVWAEPVDAVAKRYRISGVGLAKHCRRLGVPVPGRGYWARKAAGKKMRRPALPSKIPPPPKRPNPPGYTEEQIQAAIAEGAEQATRRWAACKLGLIEGDPPRRSRLHPVAARTREALRPRRFDRYRYQVPPLTEPSFPVHCTKNTVERALRLVDALVRDCERRGWEFKATRPPSSWTGRPEHQGPLVEGFMVGEHLIPIRVYEVSKRLIRDRWRKLNAGEPGYLEQKPKYAVVDTGDLSFSVARPRGNASSIGDTAEKPLEDLIASIPARMEEASKEWDAVRVAADAEAIRRHEEEQRRYQEQEKLRKFLVRARGFNRALAASEWSDSARRFLERMRPVVLGIADPEERERLGGWLDWGLRLADYMDPAVNPEVLSQPGFNVHSIVVGDESGYERLDGVAFPGYPPLR